MTRDSNTFFGEDTDTEMCFAFLSYYPKQNIPIPMCLSYKEKDLCKTWPQYIDNFPDGIDGCNFAKYFSARGKFKAIQNILKVSRKYIQSK